MIHNLFCISHPLCAIGSQHIEVTVGHNMNKFAKEVDGSHNMAGCKRKHLEVDA